MLIRWVNKTDIETWNKFMMTIEVAKAGLDIMTGRPFSQYINERIEQYEALTAVDYMSGENMGFISFSRSEQRIDFLVVDDLHRSKEVELRLLMTTLRHLKCTEKITAYVSPENEEIYMKVGFVALNPNALEREKHIYIKPASLEKRGHSFHYEYPSFVKNSYASNCPVCNGEPVPAGQKLITADHKAWVFGEYPGQGRLFGKLYIMPMKHYFHFEEMPVNEMLAFMEDVQRVGRALRKVTGAEKINYEIHANSGAHLHIHLFPRYLDDEFPSSPIDYRITEPAPYASTEEFEWFINRMKQEYDNDKGM